MGTVPGNITKVEVIFPVYLDTTIALDDEVRFHLYYNDASIMPGSADYTFDPTTEVNLYQPGVANKGNLTYDVTSLRSWLMSDFTGTALDLVMATDKGTGPGGTVINLDAMGFRVTTDETCGGGLSDTLDPVPLTDVFDAGLLQFVSADPSQNSVTINGSTGTIKWNNIGPLYAGQTKSFTLTFLGLEPSPSPQTLTNTAIVNNAYFATGERANNGQDDVADLITETGLISGVVWSDIAPTGWQGAIGYDGSDHLIPGITVTLFTCAQNETGEPIIPIDPTDVNTSRECSGGGSNNGFWRQVDSLQTDLNGQYLFDGLLDGYYYALVDNTSLPGGSGTPTAERNDPNTAGVNSGDNQWGDETGNLDPAVSFDPINSAEDITNINFGYNTTPLLYGVAWIDYNGDGIIDPDEPYLKNATVNLGGDETQSTTTDENGYYEFSVAAAGDYLIAVSPGAGWINTYDPDDGTTSPDSNSGTITVAGGEMSGSHDFGYRGSSSIGDTVFTDWNGDGNYDSGAGETGINNVVVYLYNDVNGDGIVNGSDSIVLTDTTDATGNYLFENLPPGDWVVVVDNTSLGGYIQTADVHDGTPDGKTAVTTDGSNSILDADFGYQPYGNGSIGDFVWKDVDGNGIQSGSRETGIANITVTLYVDNGDGTFNAADDPEVGQLNTDSDGNYLFEKLISGTYIVDVQETDPDLPQDAYGNGYVLSTDNDGMTVTLTTGATYLDADFGFAPPGAIGDLIYQDNNNNGQFDYGEPGISGVTVRLYEDTDNSGDYTGSDQLVDTATTDSTGVYSFTGLMPYTYVVRVDTGSAALTGFTQSGDPDYPANNSGTVYEMCTEDTGNVFGGCDSERTNYLNMGQIDFSRDFGYKPPRALGDRVWLDTDEDGVQDPSEAGLGGVTIELVFGGSTIATTTTDIEGFYSFGGTILSLNGDYTISVDPSTLATVLPAGVTVAPTYDLDGGTATPNGSTTLTINTTPYFTNTVDFGYRYNGSYAITGTVFFDQGNTTDGTADLFTAGDTPYAEIPAYLYSDTGKQIGSTTTDASGAYTFSYLFNGDYTVAVDRYVPTLTNQSLTASPNDPNTYNGVTVNNANVGDQDFGFFGDVAVLNVFKSVVPTGTVSAGDTLTYTIQISNSGTVSATNVTISDTIPLNTNYVTNSLTITPVAAADISGNPAGGLIYINPITVNAQSLVTITYRVTVANPIPAGVGTFTNTVLVSSTVGSSRTDTVTNTVAGPAPTGADLSIEKFDTPKVVQQGNTLTYTIRFANNGPDAVSAITITEELPAEVITSSFNYATNDAMLAVSSTLTLTGLSAISAPTQTGSTVIWTGNYPTGQVISGATGYITFTVQVSSALPARAIISNTAAITSNVTDPIEANNRFTETTPIANIIVEKATNGDDADTPTGPQIAIGDPVTWSYRVTNTGSITLTNVQVEDVDTLGNPVVVTPTVAITLAAGESVTWTYISTAGFTGQYSNTATVTGTATVIGLSPFGEIITSTTTPTDSDVSHYLPQGSIGDYVWHDADRDGLQDITESGIPGVVITVTLSSGTTYTATTDNTGHYTITNLAAGVYTVMVDTSTVPSTYTLTTNNQPLTVTLSAGQVYSTADFGFAPPQGTGLTLDPDHSTSQLPGAVVTYTHVLTNDGTSTDTFTLTQSTSGDFTGVTSNLPPTITLSSGATATFVITVTVPAGAAVGEQNVTVITATSGLSPTLSDTDTDTTTVTENPVIGLAKTVSSQADNNNGTHTVIYTLVVENLGNVVLNSVQITDDLASTFNGATGFAVSGASAGSPLNENSNFNGVSNLNLLTGSDSLAIGQQATVTITVVVTPGANLGPYNNTAYATGTSPTSTVVDDQSDNGSDPDPNGSGNPGETGENDPTPVGFPGLEISKSVAIAQIDPSQTVNYTIQVTNTGYITLKPVVITDILPAGFTYQAGSADPSTNFSQNGQELRWSDVTTTAGLIPNQSISVTFVATVPDTIGTYFNRADAIATHPGGVITDTDEAGLVVGDPEVAIRKDVVLPGAVNGLLTFTIRITNTGPSTLDQLPLIDHFFGPIRLFSSTPQTSIITPTANGGTMAWNDLTAPVPFGFGRNLDPGQTFVVTTVFAILTSDETFTVTNAATVPNTAEDIFSNPVTQTTSATAIELLYFEGKQQDNNIVLNWATAVEIDNFGFRIMRSTTGQYADAVMVALIPGQGHGTASGATYSFTDENVEAGQTYTYWLNDIDFRGKETTHGPVTVEDTDLNNDGDINIYLPILMKN